MNYYDYCHTTNKERRRFHAMGGWGQQKKLDKADFNKSLHTCPTRYQALISRKRRYAPNYQTVWKWKDDERLVNFVKKGHASLLRVCKILGRNPNGVVLRTIELGIEPIFKGKEYRGRYYEESFNKHYGIEE